MVVIFLLVFAGVMGLLAFGGAKLSKAAKKSAYKEWNNIKRGR